jgi:thiol:disulfide interchange protein
LILGGAAAATVAVLLMFTGNAQRRSGISPPLMVATVLAIVVLAVSTLPRQAVVAGKSAGILASQPYSQDRLDRLRAEGKTIFVYFTADWCVTCKINEASAIERKDVAEAFEASDVKVLVGDFTRRDPELAGALASYGRSGVPLYLYYKAGKDAEILPQILSAKMLIDRAKKAQK